MWCGLAEVGRGRGNLDGAGVVEIVVAEAGPGPVIWVGDEAALDGIAMDVA